MIAFREMKESDIPTLIRWIREPHVIDVWDSAQGISDEIVYDKYIKRLENQEIETYIILYNKKPIGLIQTYLVDNYLDFYIGPNQAKGIDMYIGNPDFVNKGIGTSMLVEFIKLYVFHQESIEFACIDPEIANERAIHVYEKVGFEAINARFDNHSKLLTCYMILKRNNFFAKHQ